MSPEDIDQWTRRLFRTSQDDKIITRLSGEIQEVVNEMRKAAGLPLFGWGDTP